MLLSYRIVLCSRRIVRLVGRLGRQPAAEDSGDQRFDVDAHAGGDALGHLIGAVDDVAEQACAVPFAVHRDLVDAAQRLCDVLGDLGQGLHDHFDHGRLAVLLHRLGLAIDALRFGERLGLNCFRLRAAYRGDAFGLLLLGVLASFRSLLDRFGLLLLLIAARFGFLLPLEQLGLRLLLLTVALGVRLGTDLRIEALLDDCNLLLFQFSFTVGAGNLRVDGRGTDAALLFLPLDLIGGVRRRLLRIRSDLQFGLLDR